jgi:hypothetical protein
MKVLERPVLTFTLFFVPYYYCCFIETLDHIPNSCIGYNGACGKRPSNTASTQSTRCQHLDCRDVVWDRLSTSIVTSFDASITEMNLTAQYNLRINFWIRSVVGMHDACVLLYSARLILFIHGITYANRMHEVRLAILVRESNTRLTRYMYLLGTCIRYSTYLCTDFHVSERLHRSPEVSHNCLPHKLHHS